MNITITIADKIENGQRSVRQNGELSHQISEAELQDALSEARRELWKKDVANGADLGARLFDLLNGSGGMLENALAASYQKSEPVQIALEIPFEVDALPFELLWRKQFLLLNRNISLVRRVSDRNRRRESAAGRLLSVLFMACAPRNLPDRDRLDFEREEESIYAAIEKRQVDLRIEDSGTLTGLEETLTEMNGCDVLHLTGHAGIDAAGPVFYMEDEVGDLAKVTPEMLWHAIRKFPPRTLFLSGCSTGKSDKVNDSASFAWQMVARGVPVVLGWGLPVSDTGATQLAKEFYNCLGAGKGIDEAVYWARQAIAELAPDQYYPWNLLRVFADGSPLAPLIAPGQKIRAVTPRATTHKHLQGSQVKVLERGFVGRRPEIQTGGRVLKGLTDQYGLLIHGPAGIGKSCLAGKLLERCPDKALIVMHGELSFGELFPKLRNLFDRTGNAAGLDVFKQENLEPDEKLKALFRKNGAFWQTPTILYFDDFEQNLTRRGDDHLLTESARGIIAPILLALDWAQGHANLMLTSRYPFQLEIGGEQLPQTKLKDLPLMSLRQADLQKKRAELPHINKSRHADLYLEFGGGNPRLLKWLEKIAEREQAAQVDLDALIRNLRGKQTDFVLQYLADVLAQTEGEAFQQFLRRAAVFRQPAPQAAFERITSPQPSPNGEGETPSPLWGEGWGEGFLKTGVNLTLCEQENRRGREPVYWVTPVIRGGEWAKLPPDAQRDLHAAAYDWYAAQIAAKTATMPEDWEEAVFHALECGNVRGACLPAIQLGLYLRDLLLYREAVQVQQRVAEQIDEAVIAEAIQAKDENVATLLNNLGLSFQTLGDNHQAIGFYEQAVAIFQAVYGEQHPNVATGLNNLGLAYHALGEQIKAIGYHEQAIDSVGRRFHSAHFSLHPDFHNRDTRFEQTVPSLPPFL